MEEIEESLEEKLNRLENEIKELKKMLAIFNNVHSFDMKFVNKQIDYIADKLNINLEECDLQITDDF